MSETLLVIFVCLTLERIPFSISNLFELSAVIAFAAQQPRWRQQSARPIHQTTMTMWDHHKTRFGKRAMVGLHEESVRFGNFESNDEAFHATDAQNLTFGLGLNGNADHVDWITLGEVTPVKS